MLKYKVKKAVKSKPKAYPRNEGKKFKEAQAKQDTREKKKTQKVHEKLVKLSKKLPKGQDLGHISKKGKKIVSKKVPKKLRPAVAKALSQERKDLKMLDKKKAKK